MIVVVVAISMVLVAAIVGAVVAMLAAVSAKALVAILDHSNSCSCGINCCGSNSVVVLVVGVAVAYCSCGELCTIKHAV